MFSPHAMMGLDGVEVFCNMSGSHHELRKSAYQLNILIKAATEKHGGVYLFSNQRGCDGDRLYYDGNPTVAINGSVVSRGKQFSLTEVVSLFWIFEYGKLWYSYCTLQ